MRILLNKKRYYRILARYLENKCDNNEKAIIEKKIYKDPEFAKKLEQMKVLWRYNREKEELTPVDRMWHLFKEKVDIKEKKRSTQRVPTSSFHPVKVCLRYAAMIVVLIAIPSVIYLYLQKDKDNNKQQHAPTIQYAEVTIPNGNRYSLKLSDGSKIILDAGSYIRYPKKFSQNRYVELRGEAYFEVARDEDNPFVIHANHARIKVLGTSFNVRAWQETDCVKVSVKEGIVSLKSWNDSLIKPVFIERNQFSTLTSYGHLSEPEKFDIESHMNWMRNEIRFQQASVAEVLSQLRRWYDYEFIVEDETKLNEQVTVQIVKTNVPDVLQIIARITDTNIKQEGDKVYFMNKK